MFTITSIAILCFAAILHASFQLGTSLLTLLSGHSLGERRSKARLIALNVSYILGTIFITTLALASLGYAATFITADLHNLMWSIVAILNVVIGILVMLFYFRKGKGTQLWIPRSMAEYLSERTKKTKHSAEAFVLGGGAVISELPFLVAPLSVVALLLAEGTPLLQISGFVLYISLAIIPLTFVSYLATKDRKITPIQRWREENKKFLQYVAGSGLVILGGYSFVTQVVEKSVLHGGTL